MTCPDYDNPYSDEAWEACRRAEEAQERIDAYYDAVRDVWLDGMDDDPKEPEPLPSYIVPPMVQGLIDYARIFPAEREALLASWRAGADGGPMAHGTRAYRAYRGLCHAWAASWEGDFARHGGRVSALRALERRIGRGYHEDPTWIHVRDVSPSPEAHLRALWDSPEGQAYQARRREIEKSPKAKEAKRRREARRCEDPEVRATRSKQAKARRATMTDEDRAKLAARKRAARKQAKLAKAKQAEVLSILDSSAIADDD